MGSILEAGEKVPGKLHKQFVEVWNGSGAVVGALNREGLASAIDAAHGPVTQARRRRTGERH